MTDNSSTSSSSTHDADLDEVTGSNTLWGGRFSESTDEFVQAFTASVNFDQRMYRQDIAGSKAHATMLMKSGVLTADDCDAIHDGLSAIETDIESGNFQWSVTLEDVHMNIESALTAKIGDAGKRLHTCLLYTSDAADE